jgi:hypothetical protein
MERLRRGNWIEEMELDLQYGFGKDSVTPITVCHDLSKTSRDKEIAGVAGTETKPGSHTNAAMIGRNRLTVAGIDSNKASIAEATEPVSTSQE